MNNSVSDCSVQCTYVRVNGTRRSGRNLHAQVLTCSVFISTQRVKCTLCPWSTIMLAWQTCPFEILANCCFSIEAWECDMCPDRIYAHTYIKIRIPIPCTYVRTCIYRLVVQHTQRTQESTIVSLYTIQGGQRNV